MGYPWAVLQNWKPFRIDALGLVTFLGAEEVNRSIGRLVSSRWLEYMPLLGAFVVAGDRFKAKLPSFRLYNISSGIMTSDLSSWLTRWMLAQDFQETRSLVYWEVIESSRTWWPYHILAGVNALCLLGLLVAITVLSKDWYGLANATAMVVSVLVRAYALEANRNAINAAVLNPRPLVGTAEQEKGKEKGKEVSSSKITKSAGRVAEAVLGPTEKNEEKGLAKTLIVMNDSRAVTMFIPEQLIIPVFVKSPEPHNKQLYECIRWVGWAAFSVHIVSIGSAQLAAQLYTVALLIVSTILVGGGAGCDDSRLSKEWKRIWSQDIEAAPYECWIGSHLKATVLDWPADVEFKKTVKENPVWQFQPPACIEERSKRRQDLYVWLSLTAEEEDSMGKWDLLPHQRNNSNWWTEEFNAKKDLLQTKPLDIRTIQLAASRKIDERRLRARFFHKKRKLDAEENVREQEIPDQMDYQAGDSRGATACQRLDTRLSTSGMPSSLPVPPDKPKEVSQGTTTGASVAAGRS